MATATQVRRVLLQIATDDGDSEARIAAISAQADELSSKHPELKVKIDTAAASAKVKVLRDELFGLARAPVADEPITPKVDTSEADVKLIGLRSDLEELEARAERTLTVKVDDADARVKVMQIRAQLAALGEKVEKPEISIAGVARAKADIEGIALALRKLEQPAEEDGAAVAAAVDRGFRLHIRPRVAGWGSLIIGGLAALPAAAAVTGALMAGALGAKLLVGSKAVQGPLYAQWEQLSRTLVSVMRVAALPLLQPLRQVFAQIGQWAKETEPLLQKAFGAVGPLIAPLARGLESVVSGVLPGFITLMHAAAPAVSMVAGLLGSLSRAAGGILSGLAPAVRASSAVLGSLGQVVRALAPVATSLAGSLASALAPALRTVAQVVQVLAPSVSRVLGLLVQLAGAGLQVVARSLAAVLPPVARLVSVLLDGLSPLLPPLISAVSQVAGAFSGQLARSLVTLMPAVQQFTGAALGLLQHVIVPLLPSVLQLTSLFSQLEIAAIVPLIPPVLQLEGVLLQLTDQVIVPMMPAITRVTGVLVQMANAALTAINLVSKALSLFGVASGGGMSAGGYGGYAASEGGGGGHGGEGGGASTAGYSAGVAAGSAYGSAWADGATTAATGAARKRAAARPVTVADLALILAGFGTAGSRNASLTGSAAQVRAAVGKLIAVITQDERAGVIGKSQGSELTLWLDQDSGKLQALANKRQKILAEIAAAQKYAANVASSIRQADGLQSAAAGGWNGGPQTTSRIISNLQMDVANIRKFAANITKLKKLGLNSAYLDQLIQMGPDAGGQLAEQLAGSGLAAVRQINSAEAQIYQSSAYLGKSAANAMYDSGAQAGKGFLSGLEAQQKAIEKMMAKIAKSMIDVLKHELGIHSPSTVTRDLARMTGAGIPLGLEDSLGAVRASAQRVARAMVPWPGGSGAGGYGPHGARRDVLTLDFGPNVPAAVRTWLKKSIRINGGDPAVVGA